MIKPSQRRQRKRRLKTLALHRSIARNRSRNARLLVGSGVALALAVLGWLLGLPFVWHVILVLAAFAVGFILPTRGTVKWALGWIAARAGLSYQTALELNRQKKTADSYGFADAVTQKAVKDTETLEPPRLQAWWLPLAALAIGLTLLPAPFGNRNTIAGLTLPGVAAPSSRSTSATAQDTTTQAQQEPEETDTPSEAEIETPAANADAPPVLEEFEDASGQAPEDTLSNNVGDEQALSRFLDNLSEREPPPEATNPFAQVPPENNPNTTGEQRDGTPNTQTGSEEEQPQGDPQQSAGDQNGDSSSEQPQAGQEDNSPAGQEETPSSEAQAEGEQQGEQTSTSGADSSATESDQQGAEADNPGELDEGGNDSAGQGSTVAGVAQTTDLSDEDQADPDFVEGQMREGPNNLAGTIRLPGSAEGQVFSNGSTSSYQGSEEQAITEGRIPVEYQEIVRNYFR